MIRWLRMALALVVVLLMLAVGGVVILLVVENNDFVVIKAHPWLERMLMPALGNRNLEVQLPVLLAGWLAAVFAVGSLLVSSMFYAWRRRQYENLIRRLERELVRLRNLPFTDPAPLEDIREVPDPEAARTLVAVTGLLPGELATNPNGLSLFSQRSAPGAGAGMTTDPRASADAALGANSVVALAADSVATSGAKAGARAGAKAGTKAVAKAVAKAVDR